MNLAKFTRFVLSGFKTPDLWNMPEPRDMTTPHVVRKRAAKHTKGIVWPKTFFARAFILAAVFFVTAFPGHALACAVCFGQSDSELAYGLNAGVLALFLTVLTVLMGFAGFFFFIVKRSAALSAQAAEGPGMEFPPPPEDGGKPARRELAPAEK